MIIKLRVEHQRIQGVKQVPRLIIEDSRRFVYLDLEFDEEWDDLMKTVILTNDHAGSDNVAMAWTGEPLEVPGELLVAGMLRVSCVGLGSGGLRLTTEFMDDGVRIYRAGEQTGYEPGSSVPGLWEQVLAKIGALDALNTEDKTDLVSAVNEIQGKSITAIEQTHVAEEDGGVNEFTITQADGTQTVLQVLNGSKGTDGLSPYIGENGTWWIGEVDTGVPVTGPKGDSFTFEDFTAEQLAGLKGEKGDSFTFEDFTAEQLNGLKGEPGKTPVRGTDYWTKEDIAAIKGYVDEAILGGAW